MSYTPGSFVADEQPTTAKWNLLWNNDASFNDGTGFGDDILDSRMYIAGSIDPEHLASTVWGWEELGRDTLGSNNATMTVSGFTAKKYIRILLSGTTTSTGLIQMRLNNDSGNNYSRRTSTDGAADATATSSSILCNQTAPGANLPFSLLCDLTNTTSLEKIGIIQYAYANTAGAANVPGRNETVTKWANTSAQITRVDALLSTGNYVTGSELIVLGKN